MKLHCLANVTPHLVDLEFDDPYDRLTAGDVIDKALTACRVAYREAADEMLPLLEPWPLCYRLHYITDSAAFNLDDAEAGKYDFRQDQPDLHTQACGWYRTSGQSLQSKLVDSTALLKSEPMPEARIVRWYFVVADTFPADQCTCASIYQFQLRRTRRPFDRRRAAYEESVQRRENAAPSEVARNISAHDSTAETTPVAMGRRPARSWGPDPSLYLAAFARAVHELEHLSDVVIEMSEYERPQLYEQWLYDMDDDEEWARCLKEPFDMIAWISMVTDLTDRMKKEKKLNERLQPLLEKFFDDSTLVLHDRGPDTELDMKGECWTALGFAAIWLIFENKLWNSTGGAPELQAVHAMQRRIMQPQYDYIRSTTACPTLVMGMSGSEVVWYAAYFADKLYATRLCRVSLDGSARAADAEANRAKFQVMRNLGRTLRQYYANIHTGCTYRHTPHLLPQPTAIISEHRSGTASIPELQSLHLILVDRVASGGKFNSHRALFLGTIQRKGEPMRTSVYVKFVTSYGKEAHSYLASHDPPLAPQILFYGEVVSRITMIVMEDLKAVPIHRTAVVKNPRLRSLIQPKSEEALKVLHAAGFVHGDIRTPNLLMHPRGHVYIIDFDWADKENVARYPTDLNPDVRWIRPAVLMRNKVIQKADDTFMLHADLFRLLGPDYVMPEHMDGVMALALGKRLTDSRDDGGDAGGSGRPSKRSRGAIAPPFLSDEESTDDQEEDDEGQGNASTLARQVAAI